VVVVVLSNRKYITGFWVTSDQSTFFYLLLVFIFFVPTKSGCILYLSSLLNDGDNAKCFFFEFVYLLVYSVSTKKTGVKIQERDTSFFFIVNISISRLSL